MEIPHCQAAVILGLLILGRSSEQQQNPADSRAQRYGDRLHRLAVLPGPRLYQPAEVAAVNPNANPYHHRGREAHIAAEDKRHD
jgi:hypothetical protein